MANLDFPSGFRVVRNNNGSEPAVRVMDSVSTVIYEGALAFQSATGLVRMCTSSVISSALAKKIVGVFADSKAAGAAGAEGSISKMRVYVDPAQEYSIQLDDASVTGVSGTINRIFPVLAANTGNTTTLRSISELDASAGATAAMASASAAEIVQVLAYEKVIGQDVTLANPRVIVRLVPKAHINNNNTGV